MGTATARKLELGCKLPLGWMDVHHAPKINEVVYPTAKDAPTTAPLVTDVVSLPIRSANYDAWTLAAIEILQKLDLGQRQAMVARMREYQQFLDPPASAKLYRWPVRKRGPQEKQKTAPAYHQNTVVGDSECSQSSCRD